MNLDRMYTRMLKKKADQEERKKLRDQGKYIDDGQIKPILKPYTKKEFKTLAEYNKYARGYQYKYGNKNT